MKSRKLKLASLVIAVCFASEFAPNSSEACMAAGTHCTAYLAGANTCDSCCTGFKGVRDVATGKGTGSYQCTTGGRQGQDLGYF
jgi:hypothetical protein